MRTSIFFSFLLLSSFANILLANNEARRLYKQAITDETACEQLIQYCNKNKKDALMLGYKGCATMILAKYTVNPYSKLSRFVSGKKILEEAISVKPENVELRFLRFSVQTNAPSFLSYHQNINEDKTYLFNAINNISDETLKELIIDYLEKCPYLNTGEKKKLQKLKKN